MADFGFWILDFGFWILDTSGQIFHFLVIMLFSYGLNVS